jgi:hypothetical protein
VINCVNLPLVNAVRRIAVARPRPVLASAAVAAVKPRPRRIARVCRDIGALALPAAIPSAIPTEAVAPTGVSTASSAVADYSVDSIGGASGGGGGVSATTPTAGPVSPVAFGEGPLLFSSPGLVPGPVPPGGIPPGGTPPGDTPPGCCVVTPPDIPPPIPPFEVPAPAMGAAFLIAAIAVLAARRFRRTT